MLRRLGVLGVAVLVLSGCWGLPGAPSPISGLSASATTTSVTLSWTNPTNSHWGVAVYRADGDVPPTGPQDGTFVADVGAATTLTDTGLAPGTTYSYAVTVYGADGYFSSPTTVVVTTAGLTVPGSPTLDSAAPGDAAAGLGWTAPTAGGAPITGYVVTPYVSSVAQAPTTFASTSTGQIVTGLTNGVAYTFTVAAMNAIGTGAPSLPSEPVTPNALFTPAPELGSPLNYFGGDATQTAGLTHEEVHDVVVWPTDYDEVTHAPVNAPCNIGTSAGQALGRWTSPTAFNPSGFSGSTRCLFEPRQGTSSGTSSGTITVAPPDYDRVTNLPTNVPCNAFAAATNGRWESATVWNAGARFTSGEGNRRCTWPNWTTSSVPSTGYRSVAANINGSVRPCNLAYQDVNGRWPASGSYTTGSRFTGLHTAGNQFCQYYAEVTAQAVVVADPNPIPADRSPGFWAMVYGPGQYAANGDPFSARCTSQFNCASVQNQEYRSLSDPDRGYWYKVSIPPGVSGSIDLNVFDASYNHDPASRIMDTIDGSGMPDFETEYRVFEQTNPLAFGARDELFTASSANPSDGGCWWKLRKEAAFDRAWSKLCTISDVQPGDTYLVNVRTNTVGAANEAGNNGYALEVVANGNRYANPGPRVSAYRDLLMRNENVCVSGPCDSTFYFAKIDPRYAGGTLLIELFDAGDSTGAGLSTVYPMKPSSTAPRPIVNVPASDCTFTATADPNLNIDSSDLRIHTGEHRVTAPTAPDSGDGSCGIRATVGGVRQLNGEWLRLRVDIPPGYTCDMAQNDPDVQANSCWWGIRYRFDGNASDTTTWRARIEP